MQMREHAAHRHPLACLQTEFYRELEDDGRIGSHLPLQLPVPQVLILMVRYPDLLEQYQIVSLLTDMSQCLNSHLVRFVAEPDVLPLQVHLIHSHTSAG